MSITQRLQVISVVLFLVAGCSTPSTVRELAKTTAANTSLVNTAIHAFAKNSRDTVESRGRSIGKVQDAALELEIHYQERLGALRRVEDKAAQKAGNTKSAIIDSTLSYVDELVVADEAAITKRAALNKAFAESQGKFDLPSDQLKTLSENLGTLAEKRDYEKTMDFLRKYFKEAVEQYKAGEAAATIANKVVETNANAASASRLKEIADDLKSVK